MTDSEFSSFLMGRLSTLEDRLRAELAPAEPAPVPVMPREPTAAEQNEYFLNHVEEIAGRKPEAAKAAPEVAPKTLSKASPRYARDFARYAAAIADGTTLVVD